MLTNTLEAKERRKLAKFLKKYGVIILEGYKSLPELLKEISDKDYKILYSAEADIDGRKSMSLAVAWPKIKGKPSDKIKKNAETFGRDHLTVFSTHEMVKLLQTT